MRRVWRSQATSHGHLASPEIVLRFARASGWLAVVGKVNVLDYENPKRAVSALGPCSQLKPLSLLARDVRVGRGEAVRHRTVGWRRLPPECLRKAVVRIQLAG